MTPNRRLKQARELRGWSQAKVAEQLGTDATTVSRWERGLFFPTPYFRERLCTLFSQNAAELGLLEAEIPFPEEEQRVLSPRPLASPVFEQEHGEGQIAGSQTSTIAPPPTPSWPRRGDTFAYILDSAAHDQQAHILWEDAYVRAMRGQRTEAQQLGEASLYAFEHVGHPNAEAIREWLKKNELTPQSPPSTNTPSAPLPLLPKSSKRTIKHIFRKRNVGLAFVLFSIAALFFASYAFNQISAPRVQAGIPTSPVVRTQVPTQTSLQRNAVATATATSVPVTTPTQVPTTRPAVPTSTPAANAPVLTINVTPTSLTPANCEVDSGYRCTLTVLLYSTGQANLNWKANSTSLPMQINPSNGVGTAGKSFQVIVYITSSPGQRCNLIFTLTSSSYSTTAAVSWQG